MYLLYLLSLLSPHPGNRDKRDKGYEGRIRQSSPFPGIDHRLETYAFPITAGQSVAPFIRGKLTPQNLCEKRLRPVQKNACAGVSICMGTLMADNPADTARLLEQARAGDQGALNDLFARHRARLRRMAALRLEAGCWRESTLRT